MYIIKVSDHTYHSSLSYLNYVGATKTSHKKMRQINFLESKSRIYMYQHK